MTKVACLTLPHTLHHVRSTTDFDSAFMVFKTEFLGRPIKIPEDRHAVLPELQEMSAWWRSRGWEVCLSFDPRTRAVHFHRASKLAPGWRFRVPSVMNATEPRRCSPEWRFLCDPPYGSGGRPTAQPSDRGWSIVNPDPEVVGYFPCDL